MKFEKKVALKALRCMHEDHSNFSKTLLKNMNSYLHTASKSDEYFKKVVEILPLRSHRMNMESLEIYLAIVGKIANDVLLYSHKKNSSVKKRRRPTIIKIVLTALLECAANFPILRDYIFNTVIGYCKKAVETKLEIAPLMTDFLAIYLCKFATSLEERCFKTSLELFYTYTQDDKKLLRILYTIHANFPGFFESTRASAYMKDKIRQIKFDNYDSYYLFNSELYRLDTFVDDLEFICKNFITLRSEQAKIRNYFIFVNLFCFKKKVASHQSVSAPPPWCFGRQISRGAAEFLHEAAQGRQSRSIADICHLADIFQLCDIEFRQKDAVTSVRVEGRP